MQTTTTLFDPAVNYTAFVIAQAVARKYGHTWGKIDLTKIVNPISPKEVYVATLTQMSGLRSRDWGVTAPEVCTDPQFDGPGLYHLTAGCGTGWGVFMKGSTLCVCSDVYRVYEDAVRVRVIRLIGIIEPDSDVVGRPFTTVLPRFNVTEERGFFSRHIMKALGNFQTMLRAAFVIPRKVPIDPAKQEETLQHLINVLHRLLMDHPRREDEATVLMKELLHVKRLRYDAKQLVKLARRSYDKSQDRLAQLEESLQQQIDRAMRVPDEV